MTLDAETFTMPELVEFFRLTRKEQVEAIHKLRSLGYSDYTIACATRLHVNQVRKDLAATA